ncbi:MAG: queuosine salvage family protein [Solirubrobacterales bacterium]
MATTSAQSGDESLPDRVRAACARVAAAARSVRIEAATIPAYAAALPPPDPAAADPAFELPGADRETGAAFVLCLDAINFGSGWWPTIRKRPGHSGFFTVAAGLRDRFRDRGPWDAAALRALTATDLAAILGQDPDHPLMADFAASLREVGSHLVAEHGGSFAAAVDSAGGSAPDLAALLAGWRAFADTSMYEGSPVPFFKRAQLAAADLDRVGVASLAGLDRLTAFADNLVPHVLRVDGVLRLDPRLEAKIDAGELLEHGSAAEVELRACAVHAVELLAAARRGGTDLGVPSLAPAEIDAALWSRGRAPRYKSRPRPRSRNTAY